MINLKDHEYRWWSQHGEDGVLEKIFEIVPPKNKQFVEIGAHFHEANCLKLQQHQGWRGFYFDDFHEFPPLGFIKAWVTKENINEIFNQIHAAGVSKDLDILSIDVDGVDFYLWNELDSSWKPSLVIVECTQQPEEFKFEDRVIKYDPNFRWDGSIYAGASAQAWMNLANKKGYSLVHIEQSGVNMFFMRNDLVGNHFMYTNDLESLLNQINRVHYDKDEKNREYVTSIDIMNENL
jgi:hypothetical protein